MYVPFVQFNVKFETMNAPGLSLFQGHTNININDDEAQKELEEEARKEQEERNKEVW